MENKNLTAVEWLVEEMINQMGIRIENTTIGVELFEKAKQLEKEQMIDFAINAYQEVSELMNVPFHQLSENKINFETVYNKYYETI